MRSDISKYMGPGFWYIIHKIAYLVTVTLDEDDAIVKIKRLIDIFPCDDCSNHGKNYYMNNPIEMYKGVKDNNEKLIGIYLWTFYFHNAVNAKLKKPAMRLEDSYQLYSGDEKCEDLCDISKFL